MRFSERVCLWHLNSVLFFSSSFITIFNNHCDCVYQFKISYYFFPNKYLFICYFIKHFFFFYSFFIFFIFLVLFFNLIICILIRWCWKTILWWWQCFVVVLFYNYILFIVNIYFYIFFFFFLCKINPPDKSFVGHKFNTGVFVWCTYIAKLLL